MSYLPVFIISLSSLSYEVLLTRYFSISQWNHLSFMVISIVLFGFAAAGSALSLLESRRPGSILKFSGTGRQRYLLILYSLAAAGSFLIVSRIPLDYFRMPLQWQQVLYLFITYLILMFPFFFAGLIIALAYASRPEKSGWIYFASMSGSACGALLPAFLLPLLGEGRLIILSALFPLLLLIPAARKGSIVSFLSLLLAALLTFFLAFRGGVLLEIKPSPYKLLAQALMFPRTRVTGSANTLRGRVDFLESPYTRFAPGLSLKYQDPISHKKALVLDADELLVLYDAGDPSALSFARYTLSYAGYILQQEARDVLIVQQGGGLSLPCAFSGGAERITVLTPHPEAAKAIRQEYELPGLKVEAAGVRNYLRAHADRFDLIQLENWGASIPGMASLSQEYNFTVEAFEEYLRHLKAGGILVLSRKLHLPPSDSLRMASSAFTALADYSGPGVRSPGRHLIMIRNWDSYTLLVSPSPFERSDIERVKDFCRRLNFDLVYYAGITGPEANRFNVYDEPYLYRAVKETIEALEEGRELKFFRGHFLDVSPSTDDRPFPNRFIRWLYWKDLYRSTGSRFYTLLVSGEIVVAAVLLEALLVGLALLILPPLLLPKKAPVRDSGSGHGNLKILLYFLLSGAGFMFAEMGFIQEYTLLFENHVVAFVVVLTVVLIFSGLGGAVSWRWNGKALAGALAALTLCLGIIFIFIRPVMNFLLGLSGIRQVLLALLLLFPVSFLIGVPFPAGLRLFLKGPEIRAYGWAVNGVASVLASVLAVPLAMFRGISFVFMAAGLSYFFVLLFSLLKNESP